MKRTFQTSTGYLKRILPSCLSKVQPIDSKMGYPVFARTRSVTSQSPLFVVRKQNLSSVAANPTTQNATDESMTITTTDLPKLPVPPLNDTLAKFLRTVKPLLTEQEYQNTVAIVKEFGAGVGEKLNQLLLEKAKMTDNWLSKWWLETAYLQFRSPVVVHSSPGLVFPLENFTCQEDQLRYAAKLAHFALIYKENIKNNRIPQDTLGKLKLDMSQYNKIFGTNRNPAIPSDELSFTDSDYFVIAFKNHFYKVKCYCNGKVLSPGGILKQLKSVINDSSLGQMGGLPGIPVGLLTSTHRDTWSAAYKNLIKNKQNLNSVEVIKSSLFLLSIDQPNRPLLRPKSTTSTEDPVLSEKQTVAALQMIHGNKTNSGNRWFDKTIQFIVGCEGECGLTYEHSPSEGPPIANLMDFIYGNISKGDFGNEEVAEVPTKLEFIVDEKTSAAIAAAKEELDLLINDLDMACFTFKTYGKEFIKSSKFSPDSYIQMAIQAAFHRVHGIPAAHYESASTRMFKSGRTETIRSCSVEALEFSEALNQNSGKQTNETYKLMKKAITGHKLYASDAIQGLGVDRHLLGLKLIAKENGLDASKFFNDVGYVKSSSFRISTSQVPSIYQAFMCYGPLVQDGYGCCYNPTEKEINFGISAFNSSSETNAENFKLALQKVLLDMQVLSVKNMPSKL